MAWNDKVLDNLTQLFWSPRKLGLASIKLQPIGEGADYIVPREYLSGGRSLYTRRLNFREWRDAIHKDEELLNQVIDIALAIAPRSFIRDAFFHLWALRHAVAFRQSAARLCSDTRHSLRDSLPSMTASISPKTLS